MLEKKEKKEKITSIKVKHFFDLNWRVEEAGRSFLTYNAMLCDNSIYTT